MAPDNHEVLGNLSLAYLLSGKVDAAEKTISAALKLDDNDSINQTLNRLIKEVISGKRVQPESLADLSKSATQVRKPFWKFWK